MKIDFKTSKYYFLTCENEKRRQHFLKEFADLDITEVNPIIGIGRIPSGMSGFSRMIDLAVSKQKNGEPFQPFGLFEDDVKKYREFPDSIEIPDDADLLYIGISSCGINDFSHCYDIFYKNVDENIVRVFNMLSLHGIIICSIRGLLNIQKCLMEAYFKNEIWDIYTARTQPYINAYALRVPLIYQCSELGGQEAPTKVQFDSPDRANIPEHWINKNNLSIITNHPHCNARYPLSY
jgi:hypothetical protein